MQDNNQLQAVIELSEDSGKFEMDEDGYLRFVPSEDEQKEIERWLSEEIEQARQDHKPIFDECSENIETYRAVKITIPDSGESVLPSPLARIPADQIIAYITNTILRARPIVSFDAYFPGKYPVAVPFRDPTLGITQMAPMPVEKDAEEIAVALEQGMEFKNRERLSFPSFIHQAVWACVVPGLGWAKVCRERKRRPIRVPKVKGAFLDFSDKEERYVTDGEDVRFYMVPYNNVLRPNLDDEVNDLEWIAEVNPNYQKPSQIIKGFHSEDLHLIKDEEEAIDLSKATTDEVPESKDRDDKNLKNYAPQKRRAHCDVMEVQFCRYLRVIDPETGAKSIRKFRLQGDFHVTKRRLMSCYRNPYDHQQYTLIPVQQMIDGASTVGLLKWHQLVHTYAANAEIKNAYHANNMLYHYDPDSPTASNYFRAKRTIGPGDIIPVKGGDGGEWGVVRAGAAHESLLPLMGFLAGQSQETSNVSSYETGNSIPGRTPSSTVAQILEQGQQQPLLFLRTLDEFVRKVMRLWIETARQFSPMGETIPVQDQEKKATIEVPFRFPVGEVLDNFRISLTAADEALAKEHEPEQLAMVNQLWQQYAQFVAQVAGPMMNPQSSPAQDALFNKIIDGASVITTRIMELIRTDKEKFDLRPALDAMRQEKEAMRVQMQMQQQMGAMNGNQDPNAGGAVGPTAGSGPAGPPSAGGQPGMEAGAVAPPEGGAAPPAPVA